MHINFSLSQLLNMQAPVRRRKSTERVFLFLVCSMPRSAYCIMRLLVHCETGKTLTEKRIVATQIYLSTWGAPQRIPFGSFVMQPFQEDRQFSGDAFLWINIICLKSKYAWQNLHVFSLQLTCNFGTFFKSA